MAIVARLVAPEQFGVFSAGDRCPWHGDLSLGAGGGVCCGKGSVDIAKVAPTVVSIAVVSSLALGAAMAAAAEPLSELLGSADAAGPLRVLALGVAVAGPFAVPSAQLQREFQQRRIFLANSVAFGAGSAVLLALSYAGDGAMAFAWSTVVRQLVSGAILITGVSRVYRPGFRRRELPTLLRFGLPLALANLLSQVLLNVDYVFVGRSMSTEDVGLYMLAFNIAGWPIAVLGSTLNGVVIPAFSRVQHEQQARSNTLSRAAGTVALIACPIGALTLALADPLILSVYGQKWTEAAPVLSVLAVYGVLTVFGLLFANVVIAVGRTGVLLGVQVAALLLLVPTMAIGIDLSGLVGVGYAHLVIVVVVTVPAYLLAIRRSIGVGPSVILPPLVRPNRSRCRGGIHRLGSQPIDQLAHGTTPARRYRRRLDVRHSDGCAPGRAVAGCGSEAPTPHTRQPNESWDCGELT